VCTYKGQYPLTCKSQNTLYHFSYHGKSKCVLCIAIVKNINWCIASFQMSFTLQFFFSTCSSCIISKNLFSHSEFYAFHLYNNKVTQHLKFILLHRTEALFKMDVLMRLSSMCLTLAPLTLLSDCFISLTQLGFGNNSGSTFLLFETYYTTAKQVLT